MGPDFFTHPPGNAASEADEKLAACPSCGSGKITFSMWGKSYDQEAWYCYCRCLDCSLVFVNPRVCTQKQQVGDIITLHNISLQKYFFLKTRLDRAEFCFNIVGPARRILPPITIPGCRRRWLDIGCAIGSLLEEVQMRGYEPHGLEPNMVMAEWMMRNRPYIHCTQGFLGNLPEGQLFDVISADNVLEHINEPADFITSIRHRLVEDSLLILRVPNFNNFLRPILEKMGRLPNSFMIHPVDHPCNYSRKSLQALLERCGFRIIRMMEHLMLSYPLKNVLGRRFLRWPILTRRGAEMLYPISFVFDRLIPRGGIDITIFARPK